MLVLGAQAEITGGQKSFPPFQIDTFAAQLVWLGLALVLLYVLMAKVALPRVGSILAARKRQIDDDLLAAQEFKERADVVHSACDIELVDARSRAQKIFTAAREQQAGETAEMYRQLELQIKQRINEAEEAIAAARKASLANVTKIAGDVAPECFQHLAGRVPAKSDVAVAVSRAMKRLGEQT